MLEKKKKRNLNQKCKSMSIDPDVDTFVSNDVTYCNTTYSQSKCYLNCWFKTIQNGGTSVHFNQEIQQKYCLLAQPLNDRAVMQKCKGPVWSKGSVRFFLQQWLHVSEQQACDLKYHDNVMKVIQNGQQSRIGLSRTNEMLTVNHPGSGDVQELRMSFPQ